MGSSSGGLSARGSLSTGVSKPAGQANARQKATSSVASSAALVVVLSITVFFIAGPVTRILYRRSRASAAGAHSSAANTPQRRRQSIVQSIKDKQAVAASQEQSTQDSHRLSSSPNTSRTRAARSGSLSVPDSLRSRSRSHSAAAAKQLHPSAPASDTLAHLQAGCPVPAQVASGSGASSLPERTGPVQAQGGHFAADSHSTPKQQVPNSKKSKKGKGKSTAPSPPLQSAPSSATAVPAPGARSPATAASTPTLTRIDSAREVAVSTDPPPIIDTVDEATQTDFGSPDQQQAAASVGSPSAIASGYPSHSPSPPSPSRSAQHRPQLRDADTQTCSPSSDPPAQPRQRDNTTTPRTFSSATSAALPSIDSTPAATASSAPPAAAELKPTFNLHASFQATPLPEPEQIEPVQSDQSFSGSSPDESSQAASPAASHADLPHPSMSGSPAPTASLNRSRNKQRKSNAAERLAAAATVTERVVPGLPKPAKKDGEAVKQAEESVRGRTSMSPVSTNKSSLAPLDVPQAKNRRDSTLSSTSNKSNPAKLSSSVEEDFWGPTTLKAWDANSRTAAAAAAASASATAPGLGLALDPNGKPTRPREGSVCGWSETSTSVSDAGRAGSGSTRLTSPEASPCAGPRLNGLHPAHHPPPLTVPTAPAWPPHGHAAPAPGYHPPPQQQHFHPMGFPLPPPDRPVSPAPSVHPPITPNRTSFPPAAHLHQAQLIAAHQQQQQQLAYAQQQMYAHQQQAALMQLHGAVVAQQQRELIERTHPEGWHSHPGSPGLVNGFKTIIQPGTAPNASPLAYNHQPGPGPTRQGSTASSVNGKNRGKNHNNQRVHGPLSHSYGPSSTASERPAPQGQASEEWRTRLRQTEMELDRAGKEIEIARWKLAVIEDERRAEERDHQAALRALAMRAQRAEAKLKVFEAPDGASRRNGMASSASAAGSSSAASASGSASPVQKPLDGSDLGESPPSASRSEYEAAVMKQGEGVHPLAWLDLDAVSFPAPVLLSPTQNKTYRPGMLGSPSTSKGSRNSPRSQRNGHARRDSRATRRWSHAPEETHPIDDNDDDDELEIVLTSSVHNRKAPVRKGSWREDEILLSAGESELNNLGSERSWEGGAESDTLECDGDAGYVGSLPRFIATASSSSGWKRSPEFSAEPDEIRTDHNQLPSASALEASGLPSFSLDEPSPSTDDTESAATEEEVTPVDGQNKTPSSVPAATGANEHEHIEKASPQVTVTPAVLSH